MTTGQLIKKARKKAGMTQKQLAEKLGISYVNISQLENDQRTPKYKTVLSMAAALGVEWEDLVPADEQGAIIAAHVIEKAGLTVRDKDGNIIHQGNGRKWRRMTEAEQYRAGFLQFHSEEDRIAYFYRLLNEDGKLAAGVCFFRHLDKNTLEAVADYVLSLSENPLYQCTDAPQSTPASTGGKDTTPPPDAPEMPSEGK